MNWGIGNGITHTFCMGDQEMMDVIKAYLFMFLFPSRTNQKQGNYFLSFFSLSYLVFMFPLLCNSREKASPHSYLSENGEWNGNVEGK